MQLRKEKLAPPRGAGDRQWAHWSVCKLWMNSEQQNRKPRTGSTHQHLHLHHLQPCPGLGRAPAPALKKHASLRGQGAGDTGPHGMQNTPGAPHITTSVWTIPLAI